MTLLQQIKDDQLTARKARDLKLSATLTTLYSEAADVGLNDGKRESTDEEVRAVLKKFVKNLNEIINNAGVNPDSIEPFVRERMVYESYLPTQMTEDQLTDAIQLIVDELENVSMGVVMGELKKRHDGLYDGKMASTVVRNLI